MATWMIILLGIYLYSVLYVFVYAYIESCSKRIRYTYEDFLMALIVAIIPALNTWLVIGLTLDSIKESNILNKKVFWSKYQ